MVLKAAVVFIAGGLAGSGIVALTGTESPPVTSDAQVAPMADMGQPSTDLPSTWVYLSQSQDQPEYMQARFAVQRPFAALHPPLR